MSGLERLFEIEKSSARVEGLDANELQELLVFMQKGRVEEVAMAIGIVCDNQTSLIDVICERYQQFPEKTQKLMIATLATVNKVEAQSFILQLLNTEHRADYVALIQAAIIRSEYDLSPLFFDCLDQEKYQQKDLLVECIKKRGFEKLNLYLISQDSLPHEKILRQCFGAKIIHEFKKNKAQFNKQKASKKTQD